MATGLHSESAMADRTNARVLTLACALFVLSFPLNNLFEVIALFQGQLSNWTETRTPIYFKIIKDLFLLFCVVISMTGLRKFRTKNLMVLSFFLFTALLTAMASFFFMPQELVLMGIRGYWVLLLVFVGYMVPGFRMSRIYPALWAIFLLHFGLQLAQYATHAGFRIYFENRNPGIFIIPATAGAFALFMHAMASRFRDRFMMVLSVFSLMLSNSSIGLLILIAYYAWLIFSRIRQRRTILPFMVITGLIAGIFLFLTLGTITGRGQGVYMSLFGRMRVLENAWTQLPDLVFGHGVGIATSQALLSGYPSAIIADNTYLGTLYNFGILPMLLMAVFMFTTFRYFEDKLLFFLLIGYSMTTVVFELNPVIQLILLMLGRGMGLKAGKRNPFPAKWKTNSSPGLSA